MYRILDKSVYYHLAKFFIRTERKRPTVVMDIIVFIQPTARKVVRPNYQQIREGGSDTYTTNSPLHYHPGL